MIDCYTKLSKEYGGKLTVKWVYGMVIYIHGDFTPVCAKFKH